jgi:sodium/hydrogen antiporter
LGKLGFYLPRTISRSIQSPGEEDEPGERPSFRVGGAVTDLIPRRRNTRPSNSNTPAESHSGSRGSIYRIGGSIIPQRSAATSSSAQLSTFGDEGPGAGAWGPSQLQDGTRQLTTVPTPDDLSSPVPNRTIRFPDEAAVTHEARSQDIT